MEKLRQENKELRDVLISKIQPSSSNVASENNEQTNWQPAREGYKSWETKRRELEAESRNRAIKLSNEAKVFLAGTKSTEELEAELLTGN